MSRAARIGVVAVPLAFLAVFFAYPVIAIVGRGLAPHWSVDLDPLGEVVRDAALRRIAWFTVWQATLSTLLTLAVGSTKGTVTSARTTLRPGNS
jgi:thiamine transport system permease protein